MSNQSFLQGNLQSNDLISGNNLFSNLVNSMASPLVQTARTIGGAGYELGRAGLSAMGNNNVYTDQNGNTVQDPFLSTQDLQKYSTDPTGQIVNQAKNSAAVAALGLPIGGETSLAGKTIGMGALQGGAVMGGLQALPSAQNAQDIATGVVGGAIGGKIGEKIGQVFTQPAEGASSGTLNDIANRFFRGQYKASPKVMEDFTPEHLNTLTGWDITSPKDVIQAANVITGENGVAPKVIRNAVAQAAPVDTTGINDIAQNILQHTHGITQNDADKFMQNTSIEFANKVENKPSIINGVSDITTKDPLETYDFMQSLRKTANKLSSSSNETDRTMGSAYWQFEKELEDRLFNGAGANNVLNHSTLSTGDFNKLNSISPKLAQDTQDTMQNGTIGDLKHLQQPFVTGSKAANETADLAKGSPISLRDMFATYMALHNPVVGIPLLLGSTQGGQNLLGKGISKLAGASAAMKFLPATQSSLIGKAGAVAGSSLSRSLLQKNGNQNNQNNNVNQNNASTPIISSTVNKGGVNSQKGRYSFTTPSQDGFLTGQDFTKQDNQLTQDIAQAHATGQWNKEVQLTGQQTQLRDTNSNPMYQDVINKGSTLNNFAGVANAAVPVIEKAPTSILNLNGTYDKLLQSGNKDYQALGLFLQAVQKKTGYNFTKATSPDNLLGLLDGAMTLMKNDYTTSKQKYFGGNTLNAGGSSTNPTAPAPIQPQAQGPAVGTPMHYNFNFGGAGQGLPPLQ